MPFCESKNMKGKCYPIQQKFLHRDYTVEIHLLPVPVRPCNQSPGPGCNKLRALIVFISVHCIRTHCSPPLRTRVCLQAVGTIDEFEANHGLDGVVAAKVATQRELLGRPWPLLTPKSSKSERSRVEKPRELHKGFTSYKQQFL